MRLKTYCTVALSLSLHDQDATYRSVQTISNMDIRKRIVDENLNALNALEIALQLTVKENIDLKM